MVAKSGTPVLPWQTAQWQQLWQSSKANRLPHALLLQGPEGIGKAQFASTFTQALLCQAPQPEGQYCGNCHACHLVEAKAHANILWVQPAQEGHAIKIEQIREVSEFVQQTALHNGYRIVIIHPASAMNTFAANALLKTLEEPTTNTVIMLITEQSANLPATIISRCQRLTFKIPERGMALAWLQKEVPENANAALLLDLAHGAPLLAQRYLKENFLTQRQTFLGALEALSQQKGHPLDYAAHCQEIELFHVLDLFFGWVEDVVKLQFNPDLAELINADFRSTLTHISEKLSPNTCMHTVNHLQTLYRDLLRGINLNKQLLIENLLIHWGELFSQPRQEIG